MFKWSEQRLKWSKDITSYTSGLITPFRVVCHSLKCGGHRTTSTMLVKPRSLGLAASTLFLPSHFSGPSPQWGQIQSKSEYRPWSGFAFLSYQFTTSLAPRMVALQDCLTRPSLHFTESLRGKNLAIISIIGSSQSRASTVRPHSGLGMVLTVNWTE